MLTVGFKISNISKTIKLLLGTYFENNIHVAHYAAQVLGIKISYPLSYLV